MNYKTIKLNSIARFTEKKSEFISQISHVKDEESALNFINEIKAANRKAAHNCYAYILRENNTARHSDDGEPQGTAGVPIYDTLKKEELVDVVCVVTRYFGGILLGAGGLVRAYGKAASDAVRAAEIQSFHTAVKIKLSFDYSLYGKIKNILPAYGMVIENEIFGVNVEIILFIKELISKEFINNLTDICAGDITVENLGIMYCNFMQSDKIQDSI